MSKTIPFPKMLENTIKDWVISNVETLDIAVVTDVAKFSQRLVSVRPLCIQEDLDGIAPEKPVIYDCPVLLQGNVDGYFSFPLRVGDKVVVGYPKDSIEEFIASNNTNQYYQIDNMKFQGSEAIVLGAIGQPSVDKPLSSTDLELNYFDSKVSITPNNVITIETPSGSVVINNNNITIQSVGNVLVNGATVNTNGNVITASGADLDEIRSQLDSFKAAYEAHGSGATNHPPPSPF